MFRIATKEEKALIALEIKQYKEAREKPIKENKEEKKEEVK